MEPGTWIILLMGSGAAMLLAELALPTHGVLGVMGIAAIFGGIGVSFAISPWIGLGLLLGAVALTPIAWSLFIHYWPRSPIGRRLVLQPIANPEHRDAVKVGQVGRALSELRPMGICEFGSQRLEAVSAYGMIAAGQAVQVVEITGNRLVVRPSAHAA